MAPKSESKERMKLFIFQEKRLFPYQRKKAKEKPEMVGLPTEIEELPRNTR